MLTFDVSPTGSWNRQDLVNAWRGQAFVHALGSALRWLAIRLNRFQQVTASGEISKVRTAIRWCTAIQFLGFSDVMLDVHSVSYAVHAFSVHLGNLTTSGHYRALLYITIVGRCAAAMIMSSRFCWIVLMLLLGMCMLFSFPNTCDSRWAIYIVLLVR